MTHPLNIWLCGLICCGQLVLGLGQDTLIQVSAQMTFLEDTVAVGKPFGIKLAITHPTEVVVLFPREADAFAPFEPVSVHAKPTKITGPLAYDEATIYIRTFDITPVQSLSLTYGYLSEGDTIWQKTETDSIKLVFRVDEANPTLMSFQGNVQPIQLNDPPNYVLIGGVTLLGILVVLGLIRILRAPANRYFASRKLQSEYLQIEKQRKALATVDDSSHKIESLNEIWKTYLDPSLQLNIKSLTRTELQGVLPKLTHLTPFQRDLLAEIALVGDQVLFAQMKADDQQLEYFRQALAPILLTEYERRKAEAKGNR